MEPAASAEGSDVHPQCLFLKLLEEEEEGTLSRFV